MIFLDTDILSYFFAGNVFVRDKLREAVNKGDQISITAITVYEFSL
jgi:predicted nucleic acid-binding protein